METKMVKPQNVGVINPYALAEVVKKRKINWKRISDPKKLLEETLGMPYEKLFDPKFGSPLYAGMEYDPATKSIKMAKEIKASTVVLKALKESVGGTIWADPGEFYNEGTEMTDPVQGAVGDCYYIAALSSIAWARPYVIAQKTRATGTGQQDFVDMVEFYKAGKAEKVEVTEKMPLQSPGNSFIYARSSEAGEIWPCVYEKAYAKWRNNDAGDSPDITKIAGGDPVGAMATLTGFTPYYFGTASMTEDQIWQKIRENCISYKTFNPMVAWTYGSAPSPDVNYSNAHIAANHAYSIFGWQFVNNQKYVVLRNPWGCYDATLNVDGHIWTAWDQPYYGGKGYWRPVEMAKDDGVFALRLDTFKKYYAGFGFIKTPESPN